MEDIKYLRAKIMKKFVINSLPKFGYVLKHSILQLMLKFICNHNKRLYFSY